MPVNKMLIDATHPEETRVVVLRENRVEEFDYESAARKLLRGSIYLAKITRVEPSLQASFVDYGGNRHGFLAFAEIHPDYYQIPHADKLALLEQESQDQAAYEDDLEDDDEDTNTPNDDTERAEIEAETGSDEHPTDERALDETDVSIRDTETTAAQESADTGGTDATKPAAETEQEHDFEASAIDVTALLPEEPAPSEEPQPEDEDAKPASAKPLDVDRSSDDTISQETDASTRDEADIETAPGDENDADEAQVRMSSASEGSEDDDQEDPDEADVVESLNDVDEDDDDAIEALAGEDDADEDDAVETDHGDAPARRTRKPRPRRRPRHYKIQEVIKRRQIVLIQVVKEERGNKGAALTTYLSLAGRYTVLMPNTARGGGISRKITNVQDRKRLKAIAQELEVPEGMGLIIRTAGAARTKQEIKRDFEYLLRLWESVRSLTLESTAPSLVYEEGNLIKRSIRDLYTKEIDEVIVAGERAHKEAKSFMRMLMPSHAKNVIRHDDSQSLFAKFRIEQQLNAMFSPNVQLKSGGYLVINQTEALVAIDVNSGKSTREFSIEETALNTNLEAAEELSRQLKLRDLAGLIVVDFIDMEEKRNNRAVERRLKDSLRADRARIQVGRISHFGLLEMSRQRLRTGVLEGSTTPCEHCQGSGIVRSIESVSLAVLRGLEDTLVAGKITSCVASCASDVALYLLNQKRPFIQELEERYGVVIHVRSSSKQQGANFLIEPLHDAVPDRSRSLLRNAVNIDAGFSSNRVADNDDVADEAVATETKPRRRRRRRGRRDDNRGSEAERENTDEIEVTDVQAIDENTNDATSPDGDETTTENERTRRSRRRGRRGGRRHREQRAASDETAASDNDSPKTEAAQAAQQSGDDPAPPTSPTSDVTAATAPGSSASDDTAGQSAHSGDDHVSLDASETDALQPILEQMETLQPANGTSANGAVDTIAEPEDTVASLEAESPAQEQPHAPHGANAADLPRSEAPAEQAPDRKARSQPVAGEPVIQRVVVRPGGQNESPSEETTTDNTPATDTEVPDAPKPPTRRGWWQRQFGG